MTVYVRNKVYLNWHARCIFKPRKNSYKEIKVVLKAFTAVIGLALLSCTSKQEKTQELFTEEDNYYDYNYYDDPIDPLTDFSRPYNRPVYQEPEVYYEEIQLMQDFSNEEKKNSDSEEAEQVEREGARGYLYEGEPPPRSSEWFFEDY
jgi:hypothetical protein